jgi:transcriptional regulator with XRE-family HTH domain
MKSTWNIRTGLRLARESRGWSQSDLAIRTGLQPSAISHFETGQRVPSLGNLIRLSDCLALSLDSLCQRHFGDGVPPFSHTRNDFASAGVE